MSGPDPEIRQAKHRYSPTAWLLGYLSPEVAASWSEAVRLIEALQSEGLTHGQCRILKSRWVGQTLMYERLWRSQRATYHLFRVPIILAATTIPVLASLAVDKKVIAFVGLAVALLTALDGFFQLSSRWQQHRHTATVLGFEGWAFLELSGGYAGKDHSTAYGEFMGRLETLNRRAALSYLDLFHADAKKDVPTRKHGSPEAGGEGDGRPEGDRDPAPPPGPPT